MRSILSVGLFLFVGAVCSEVAWGQLDLRLETPKSSYLQYAPVPVIVKMKNLGSGDLVFSPQPGEAWLEVIVQSADGLMLRPDRLFEPPAITLRPGEDRSLPLDLAPYFLIREPGAYRVRASVRVPGGETLLTEPLSFMIGKGETIWNLRRGEGQDRRNFSLVKYYEDPNVGLYLLVEVPEKNQVFPARRLGPYVPLGKPAAEFDAKNHLHLLYPSAPGQYRLMVVNQDGNPLREETRREAGSTPRLRKGPDGLVDVEGGAVILPSHLREKLSTLQARAGALPSPE